MNTETRQLPLWKNCVEKLAQMPLGEIIPASFFEAELSCRKAHPSFSPRVGKVRLELRSRGRYLRKERDNFRLLDKRENVSRLRKDDSIIGRRAKRMIQFSASIDVTGLTQEEQRAVECLARKSAMMLVIQRKRAMPTLNFTPEE